MVETWFLTTVEPQAQKSPLRRGEWGGGCRYRVTQHPGGSGPPRPGFGPGRVWGGKKRTGTCNSIDPNLWPRYLRPGSEVRRQQRGREGEIGKGTQERRMQRWRQHRKWGKNRKTVWVPTGFENQSVTETGFLPPPPASRCSRRRKVTLQKRKEKKRRGGEGREGEKKNKKTHH